MTTIIENDEIKFVKDVILLNKPFYKEYMIKDIPVIFRTRQSKETKEIIKKVGGMDMSNLETVKLMNDCNLAFSLSSFNKENLDIGTLDERLEKLENMPTPKVALLWDYLGKFEEYIESLRATFKNF